MSLRKQKKQLVTSAVVTTFETYKHRYGARRITVELNETGIPCSLNHIADIMTEKGLKARNGKHYKYFPSFNARNHVSDNLLARNFTASKPNEKWASDITYIKVERGHVYLAVVMDLFSRKIIGWSLDTSMTNQLIIDAFNMAVATRQVQPGCILHSDRGVQYRSGEYQYLLINEGIKPSMSRKGNCWDNAAMESFFGRMKLSLFMQSDLMVSKMLIVVYLNILKLSIIRLGDTLLMATKAQIIMKMNITISALKTVSTFRG